MISFTLTPATAAASATFVEQEAVNRAGGSPAFEHHVLLIGQFDTALTPTVDVPQALRDVADARDRYGEGSLLALMAEAVFRYGGGYRVSALPVSGGTASATATVTVVGTAAGAGEVAIYIAGRRVAVGVASGDTAAAIGTSLVNAVNADPRLPVSAADAAPADGTVTLAAKWAGLSGNQIDVRMGLRSTDVLPTDISVTVPATNKMTGGAGAPDLTAALAGLGDTWYSEIANPYDDGATISAVETACRDRQAPGVKRMCVQIVGFTGTIDQYTSFLGGRNSEFTVTVPVLGSPSAPFEIAPAFAGMWAGAHGSRPGVPVRGNRIPGILAGGANDLTYAVRDQLVKAGGSHTYNLPDGGVTIGDTVTTRTTTDTGVPTDDWRFAVIIPNLQFKINALDITFSSAPFQQAVIVADSAPPAPTYAVRPNTVVAYALALVNDWSARGLTADRDTVAAGVTAEIDAANPGRVNLLIPDIPSAGLRILAAKVEWAFLVGGTN